MLAYPGPQGIPGINGILWPNQRELMEILMEHNGINGIQRKPTELMELMEPTELMELMETQVN